MSLDCAAGRHFCWMSLDDAGLRRRVSRSLDVARRRWIASPGGTASESALLHARLKSLKNRAARRHQSRINRFHRRFLRFVTRMKPSTPPEVLAYVDELCTSGGYFAASAADSIIASPCALVGSIGVIQRGFGFHRALRKDGVERRILAAGDAKAGLDVGCAPARQKQSGSLPGQQACDQPAAT